MTTRQSFRTILFVLCLGVFVFALPASAADADLQPSELTVEDPAAGCGLSGLDALAPPAWMGTGDADLAGLENGCDPGPCLEWTGCSYCFNFATGCCEKDWGSELCPEGRCHY